MTEGEFAANIKKAIGDVELPSSFVPTLEGRMAELAPKTRSRAWLVLAAAVLAMAILAVVIAPLIGYGHLLFWVGRRSAPAGAPSAQSSHPSSTSWPEDLTLSGEVNAHATATVPSFGAAGPLVQQAPPGILSSCTGQVSKAVGSYTLTLVLNTDQGLRQLDFTLLHYHGPGTYAEGPGRDIRMNLVNIARTSNWSPEPTDAVTVTVDPGEERGTVNATLSRLTTGLGAIGSTDVVSSTPEVVRGMWTCKTSV